MGLAMQDAAPGFLFAPIVIGAWLWAFSDVALGETIASDSASSPAYASEDGGAWKGLNSTGNENPAGSDNGGFGFEPWDFAGGFHAPDDSAYGELNHFIDGVDFPASGFNDLGAPAFALANADRAGFNLTSVATRPFVEPMRVGDTFSVDFDTPAVYDALSADDFPFTIISFLDAAGGTTFLIEGGTSKAFGDFNWRYDDASNDNFDTGVAPTATNDGSTLSLTPSSPTTAQLVFDGQSFEIGFAAGAPAAVSFTLFSNASGDGMGNATGERELFFNNLSIVGDDTQGLPGDYNDDGVVTASDYAVWRDNLNAPSGSLPNDVNGGQIGPAQYATWRANFGSAESALVSTLSVPAPATVTMTGVLLLAGASARLTRNRRWKTY